MTKKLIPPSLLVLLFSVLTLFGSHFSAEAAEEQYEIRWEIDRSTVPTIVNGEITLNIAVGEASAIVLVDENGDDIPYRFEEEAGVITLTTAGDVIDLSFFTNTIGNPLIGSYAPTTLKDDYLWAWSHGIDDNANMEGSIAKFEERGWRGTLYLIGTYVDRPWSLPGLMEENRIRRFLNNGWSLGNHTYNDTDCDLDITQFTSNIVDGQTPLNRIIAESERPDYIVMGFAAPCFLEPYHPKVQELRRNGESSLVFNESGGRLPIILDSNSNDEIIDDILVHAYEDGAPIGRDGEIDEGELDSVIEAIDWISRNSNENRHLWYNSLSHGERDSNVGVETRLGGLVEYVYRTYGPLGTDEVWVAPADEIVSYVTMRDFADIRVASATKNSVEMARTDIRRVANNSVGNLESSGFLPTRERIADTPIPILIEPVKQSTPEPQAVAVIADESSEGAETENDEVAVVEAETEVDASTEAVDQSADSSSSNLRLFLIIGVVVFGLIILAAVFFLIARFRRAGR